MNIIARTLLPLLALCLLTLPADAAEVEKDRTIQLGKLAMKAPKGWEKKTPRVRIIAYEYAAPAAKEDKIDGRLTIMSAGGTIEDNIDRWIGQFSQADGGSTKERAKIKKTKVSGNVVHLVELAGTYKDQRGPFAKATYRKDYRMLAAIIETGRGNVFVKLYGPKRTIAKHETAFREMVESLK